MARSEPTGSAGRDDLRARKRCVGMHLDPGTAVNAVGEALADWLG